MSTKNLPELFQKARKKSLSFLSLWFPNHTIFIFIITNSYFMLFVFEELTQPSISLSTVHENSDFLRNTHLNSSRKHAKNPFFWILWLNIKMKNVCTRITKFNVLLFEFKRLFQIIVALLSAHENIYFSAHFREKSDFKDFLLQIWISHAVQATIYAYKRCIKS